jgi:rhodanese-related sulfurtransferase
MKTLIILIIVLANVAIQSKEEYVCIPCGQECDNEIHSGPGSCSACGMELVKKSSIRFSNIDLDEMCKRISVNPDVVLLDVRTSAEFKGSSNGVQSVGHFKKAININVNELNDRIGELLKYKDSELIVYCSHSHRSPQASYWLGTSGFTNGKNMLGGVSTFPLNSDCLKKEFIFHSK